MVGGQVSSVISIIIKNNNNNNNNNNDDDDDDDNNNNSLNGFQQALIDCAFKVACSHQLWPSGLKIFVHKYNVLFL